MSQRIAQIRRYPVKGLQPQILETVTLSPGRTLPGDRMFALAKKASRFDPQNPTWLPKGEFLNLVRHERLARLGCEYDDASGRLTVRRDGRKVVEGEPASPAGRAVLEQFFSAFLQNEAPGGIRLARGADLFFTDASAPLVSVINLASLRDVERVAYGTLNPHRFRANIYYEGARPWEEMDWIGAEIAAGEARLRLLEPIQRCAATNVNPDTAERDMNVLFALEAGFRHLNLGVYAEVTSGGEVALGNRLVPTGCAPAR